VIGDARPATDHVCLAGYRHPSDIGLLRDFDGVVDLDAEVAHRAFDLRVTEQELHGSKVTRPPVDQHGFGTSQRMRAELRRMETDAGDPFQHEPSVLTRGESAIRIAPAGE
jgi:hypothetical protein